MPNISNTQILSIFSQVISKLESYFTNTSPKLDVGYDFNVTGVFLVLLLKAPDPADGYFSLKADLIPAVGFWHPLCVESSVDTDTYFFNVKITCGYHNYGMTHYVQTSILANPLSSDELLDKIHTAITIHSHTDHNIQDHFPTIWKLVQQSSI